MEENQTGQTDEHKQEADRETETFPSPWSRWSSDVRGRRKERDEG